jgi:hypothetical protein
LGVRRPGLSVVDSMLRVPGPAGRRAAAVFAAAVALAGCANSASSNNGVAGKKPAAIVAAAKTAAEGAATVRVAGSILVGRTPISLDMELVSGKGGQGRIVLDGVSIQLVEARTAVYINSSAAFYRRFTSPAVARRLAGKWLKGSARGAALGALTALTNLRALTGDALAAHEALAPAGDATVQGQKAVAVTDLTRGGTLYVATTGAPYPLEIRKGGTPAGELTFDRWNQPVSLEPPPDAISVKQLQRR